MQGLSGEGLVALVPEEVHLIDIRPRTVLIRGHLKETQNILCQNQKGREIPERETIRPGVVIGMAGVIPRQAAMAWRDAGHRVAGYWDGSCVPLEAVLAPEWTMDRYHQRPGLLFDVRLREDQRRGVMPGSLAIPLPLLPGELAEVARDIPILAYWAIGIKVEEAAPHLLSRGFSQLSVIASGGIDDWYQLDQPMEMPHG